MTMTFLSRKSIETKQSIGSSNPSILYSTTIFIALGGGWERLFMDINKIIKDNEGLIGKVIKDVHFRCVKYEDFEDVYSAGRIGLYNGIMSYDGSVKPSTYYYKCIKNEILRTFQFKSSKKNRFNESFRSIEYEYEEGTLEEVLADDTDIERDLILEETKKEVKETIKRLKPKYQKILILHFGIDCEPVTFEGMVEMLGTTRQNIHRTYLNAKRDFIKEWKYENKRCKK